MKGAIEPMDIKQKVWTNWNSASTLTARYADKQLSEETNSTFQQFAVLLVMKQMGENANATEMAKMLNKNTNTLSTILDRMEAKGLVKKNRDTEDRRIVYAIMTEKGKKKLVATEKANWELFDKLASSFSLEELKTLNALLEKLIKTTEKALKPEKPANKRSRKMD
jgi:MarR family transcriptional regulator, organic hydroperoxide resistance regulator